MVAEQALPFDSTSGSIGSRPGGTSVFAGLHEGGVVELDAKTLEIIGEPLKLDLYVSNVDISPDGKTLAVALFDSEGDSANSVLLVDYETKEVRATFNDVDASWKLFFSADGSTLAAGGSNGLITLIDPAKEALIGRPLRGVDGPVNSAAFSPDSKLLVAGSFDGTVELWEVARRARVARITPGDTTETTFVWFDATGENVMVASEDGGVWSFPSSPDDWAARACAIAGRNLSRDEWGELMGDRSYRVTCPGLPEPE
jgi:WD40 repeat protein